MRHVIPCLHAAQSGFSYVFVLFLITLIGIGLAAAGSLWQTESRRASEVELLFIGNQYRQAIRSYYELDPAQPRLPTSIDDLLADHRRPNAVHHLRRAWRDPMTGESFTLIRAEDGRGILGVHSRSTRSPLKIASFAAADDAFSKADTYADWHFVFTPPSPP